MTRAILPALAALGLAAAAARASQSYPSAVSGHLSLPYVPACSLCHEVGKAGAGTAETPFARSARARGLRSGDAGLVGPALDALARDNVDSDGDGVSDIRELLAGTDPNVAGGSSIELRPDPGYGCGTAGGHWSLVVLALLVAGRRASRRHHPFGRALGAG